MDPDPATSPAKSPLAQIRHDLRTPINHILGYSELLAEEAEDAGHTAYLDDLSKIRQAAKNLLEGINTRLSDDAFTAAHQPVSGEPDRGREPKPDKPTFTLPLTGRQAAAEHAAVRGHILLVDDNAENRSVLARGLARQGHTTSEAADGDAALAALRSERFDLVLLDVVMPVRDGYSALCEMKDDPDLRDIPVVMISALDEIDAVVRCIEAGAEDFLAKPFNPTLLRARIGAGLEKKRLRDQEREYLRTIERTQARLKSELEEAANYVRSILPEPVSEPLVIKSLFVPSTELGGDSFGYHRIDDDHFAFYLLDVCGHGVGAALLSVAAINALRASSLPGTDFRDPSAVLAALNETFPMERHNQMYFTIWYGVFRISDRTLFHASGGHPPAILVGADGAVSELRSPGMLIGAMPGMTYASESVRLEPGSKLFVFSDGAYEIKLGDGSMLDWDTFRDFLAAHARDPDALGQLATWAHDLNHSDVLDDDLSILDIAVP